MANRELAKNRHAEYSSSHHTSFDGKLNIIIVYFSSLVALDV
ncbi:hypothetical protein [Lactiplantibacillus plantarum]|nr:hypothetical protein [Lactiplantibacillus plantarum]